MNPASVGFQCPSCVASGRASGRAPRTTFGAILKPGGGTGTKVVMGVLAAEWLLSLLSGRLLDQLLVMSNEAVYLGQFWRLFTASLTSGTIFGLLMNVLVRGIAGRALESELGANDIDSGGYDWKKLVSGRELWNFSKHEYDAWRAAL